MATGCEQTTELLSALVDGELDDDRRKVLATHILTCPECSRMAGALMAAKRVTQRSSADVEAPAGFHARLRARLDQVDGVRSRVAASRPARRLVGIAAMGAIAVSIAIIFSTVYLINADRALSLAQLHQQLASVIAGPPSPGPFATVSCNPETQPWTEVRRALVRVDGAVVQYTLYQVGGCPVSVFEGPAEWNPYRTGWLVSERIGDLDVRRVGDQAMTTVRKAGSRDIIVAAMPPEHLAAFARAWRTRPGRSPGL